jgi:hypothetical protein
MYTVNVGRRSLVDSYGLDSPGTEVRWWARYSTPAETGPEDSQPPEWWVPGLILGRKAAGTWG